MIRLKRVYSEVSPADGIRILVDRVWPRGISKRRAHIIAWRKDLAPSTPLRKWFGHEPSRWAEFRRRYQAELNRSDVIEDVLNLAGISRQRTITLLYSAADEQHNQAVVLKDLLERCLTQTSKPNA